MLKLQGKDIDLVGAYKAMSELALCRKAVQIMVEQGINLDMSVYRTRYNEEEPAKTVCGSFGCILGNMAHLHELGAEFNISAEDVAISVDHQRPIYRQYSRRVLPTLTAMEFKHTRVLGIRNLSVWEHLFGAYHYNSYEAFLERVETVEGFLVTTIEYLRENA